MLFGLWTWVGPRQHVLGGVYTSTTWRIPLNRPCVAVMRRVVKLLWPLVVFMTRNGLLVFRWLFSLVIRVLDSQLDALEVKSQPLYCWVTTLGMLFICLCRSQLSSDFSVRGPGFRSFWRQLCLSWQPPWYTALGTGCTPLYCST